MTDAIYKELCQKFVKRGGRYPGMDIPEFYEMAAELFTPEEVAVAVAIPRGLSTAGRIAEEMGKDEGEVGALLKTMAEKGLLSGKGIDGVKHYALPPFVPGIFEYVFMRGTSTERDRRLAELFTRYKEAVDSRVGIPEITFPTSRVITVNEKIESESKVHTYDQMLTYVDKYDPISVVTCYCRHEALLVDENDTCGKPNDNCLQFGDGARFIIDNGLGKEITKEEAVKILKEAEEAGLVHCTNNMQEISFVCNCCPDHCLILKTALAQPKPGQMLYSGFQPEFDADECTGCETCVNNCPATALVMGDNDVPLMNIDRCIGCGVCATGCPTEAVKMVEKAGYPEPPVDQNAFKEALKANRV